MMGMGPEMALVKSRVDPRAELAQFAAHVGSRAEVRAVEEMIRRELEFLPVRRSAAQRFLRWGKKRLQRGEESLEVGPAVWAKRADEPAEGRAAARTPAVTSLAAMPALRSGMAPKAGASPIPAAPVFARECP